MLAKIAKSSPSRVYLSLAVMDLSGRQTWQQIWAEAKEKCFDLWEKAFLTHADRSLCLGSHLVTKHNWLVLKAGIRTQNNNKILAAALTSYVWIAEVIKNILLLPLYKRDTSGCDDQRAPTMPSDTDMCFMPLSFCFLFGLLGAHKYMYQLLKHTTA